MQFNETIEYEITADLETEPVSVDELKRHLNLLFDTDGSYEFTDDDTYLGDVIKASRKYLESYTGLSFGEKTIIAILRNELADVEIPFGPITTITTIKDVDGNTIAATDYTITGRQFKKINRPISSYLEVTYAAGYTALPEDLKRAILEEAAFRYNHRGEEVGHSKGDVSGSGSYCKSSLEIASAYKRTSWLI